MAEETSTGAATPTSASFDAGAQDLVPSHGPQSAGTHGQVKRKLQLSGSFNTISGASSSGRMRPPMPLYSSDTWSPTSAAPLRSAGIPPKSSWDSFDRRSSVAPPLPSPSHSFTTGDPGNMSLPARAAGAINGNVNFTRNGNGRVAGAQVSPGPASFQHTRTLEYHNSPTATSFSGFSNNVAQTDPLPQRQFTYTGHKTGDSSSGGSFSSRNFGMLDTPRSSTSTFASQIGHEQQSSDDQQSVASGSVALSDHYTMTNPDQAGSKCDVWAEKAFARSLRRGLKDPHADWEEAYPGALAVLSALNPEHYQMPYGTRAVNIKSEYPKNVLTSIRVGKYSVMRKVADRIMQVWEAREDPAEKVIFLFSINGSKRFAGLAEMCGPYNPEDSIADWIDASDATAPSVGSFPVTWVYVKDIPYHQFSHIRQPHNDHPVGNMWNGMNFPSDIGRMVIEKFVTTPATSSILGYPRNYKENEALLASGGLDGANDRRQAQRRGTFSSRGERGGGRGGRGGLRINSQNWRSHHDPNQRYDSSEEDHTPLAARPPRMPKVQVDGHAPNLSTAGGGNAVTYQPGMLMTVAVNDRGRLVLVPAPQSSASSTASSVGSRSNHGSRSSNAMAMPGVSSHAGGLHGARSLNSLHQHASSMSAVRPPSAANASLLHPAVSMGNIGSQYGMNNQISSFDSGYGTTLQPGDETPTHRPPPHAARGALSVEPKLMTMENVEDVDLLLAKFHTIVAEQYALQHQLKLPTQSDMAIRLLNAKSARAMAEKNEVGSKLGLLGVKQIASYLPVRRDSVIVANQQQLAITSGNGDISPGRVQGTSMITPSGGNDNTPQAKENTVFDKAPGGSGRAKSHTYNQSWDLQMKKSITDLIKSPKKSPVPASSGQPKSPFFPQTNDSADGRVSASFPTPSRSGPGSTPTDAMKNFSFGPGRTPTDTSKSFSFGPPAEQSFNQSGGSGKQNFSFYGSGGGANLN